MRRAGACVGLSVLALALGCAGLRGSTVPRAHMDLVCDAHRPWAGAPEVSLAPVALAPATIPAGPAIAATVRGVSVEGGGWVPWQPEAIASALAEGFTDEAQPSAVNVYLGSDVQVRRVVLLLEQLQRAGLDHLRLVARSLQPLPIPASPDPSLAVRVRAQLDGLEPPQRVAALLRWVEAESWRCPAASAALAASLDAPAEQRCTLAAEGLVAALPGCPLADGDRFLTLAQLMHPPRADTRPTALQLRLDPRRRARVLPATMLWSEALSELASGEPPAGLGADGG